MTSYHTAQLPEYQGNPLIEALPPILDDKSVILKLANFPLLLEKERQYEPHLRSHIVERLKHLRQPMPMYLNIFRMIERAMFEGYANKNPLSPTTANWLHRLNKKDSPVAPKTGRFKSNARTMCLIGISGIGKTKMLEQILAYFGDVIDHKTYNGKPLHIRQIPWVKVQCPHDTTLTGFCKAIIRNIHIVTGEEPNFDKTIEGMISQIQSLVRQHFVGIIVVDDFQNTTASKAGGEIKFINFLLNLIDEAGVPIVFIANPEAIPILKAKFRLARRSEEGGYEEMGVLTQEMWDSYFVDAIWRYQWTSKRTVLTPELSHYWFNLSKGLIDIAIRVYMEAQRLVIGSDDERLSTAVFEQAFRKACKLTGPALDVLALDDLKVKQKFEDLFLPAEQQHNNEILNCTSATSSLTETPVIKSNEGNGISSPLKPLGDRIADFDRIHHPEFQEKIRNVMERGTLFKNELNLNVIRSVSKARDKVEALTKLNYIVTNSLKIV